MHARNTAVMYTLVCRDDVTSSQNSLLFGFDIQYFVIHLLSGIDC